MDNQAIFQHYSQILDKILDTSEFFQMYFQSCYILDDDLDIALNTKISTGVSRGCLIDQDYDYVVKFPLHDSSNCERETMIFQDAVNNHLDNFFIQPTFIGTYQKTISAYKIDDIADTIEWYTEEDFNSQLPLIQEKYKKQIVTIRLKFFAYKRADTCNDETFMRYSIDDEEYAENSTSPLREYNLAIAAAFIADYGPDEYERLTVFLYEWDINDIHFGNVGEIDNHIVIIDYAGV